MSETYDINSIQSLSFREGVRTRIQMYLGSDDIEGTYQALKEIINNSTDEALAGYGKRIEITVDTKQNAVSVIDYGRGVPFGIREDGENVLVSIFTKSHTGGKFSHDVYKNASGLNGIGGSCVCLSSLKFEVQSVRDTKGANAYFEKGNLVNYHEFDNNNKHHLPNGTYVRFIPDPEVFNNGEIGYDYERICQDIKDISYLYTGIEFVVSNDETGETRTYCAKNGIVDFVADNVKEPLQKHIITGSATDGTDSVEIAFQWGTKHETPYVFVNGLRCPELGTPVTGARTALTKVFNNLADAEFDGEYIRKNLFYVINCKVENPSFANQTKSKINNPSLRTLASNAFTSALKEMATKYNSEFNTIAEMLRKVEKAEAAAERARQGVLNFERKADEKKAQKVTSSDKFKDCEKHGQDSMLIICEGNSALGGLMPARNVMNEALYAVRGKVKNLLKHPLDECLENEEVSDVIMALGCGIQNKYNSKKLNYGKVAIAVDADADGYNIMCLIATMFYVLMPDFIKEGRLCWLRAPLYRLTKGDKRVFAYDDAELAELRKKYPNWEQGRNKGLGEMSAEDMKNSMLHPTGRRLEILTVHDADAAAKSLEMLMGEDVEPRKEFLFENVDFSVLNN
jgi:DNA gyrase/topoisomerase IV subunit B